MIASLLRYPRRRALPVLAVAVLVCGSGWALAQQVAPAPQPADAASQESPQGRIIKAVDIEGLQAVPEAFVRARLRTRVGNTYDEAEVRADLRRLIESNRFNAADATYRVIEEGQVVVTFRVQEKALLSQVQFEGNAHISTKDLLGATGLTPGAPADIFSLRQAIDKIQQQYREGGYYYAQISLDEEKLQAQGIALFRIVEGPRVKTRKIEFEGNKSFPASRLTGSLETKTYIWIFRKGAYDPRSSPATRTTLLTSTATRASSTSASRTAWNSPPTART